jgi:hypothetical protein
MTEQNLTKQTGSDMATACKSSKTPFAQTTEKKQTVPSAQNLKSTEWFINAFQEQVKIAWN